MGVPESRQGVGAVLLPVLFGSSGRALRALGLLSAGGLDDEQATGLAVDLKRHGGDDTKRLLTEERDPSPEEVRDRREARRRAERDLTD